MQEKAEKPGTPIILTPGRATRWLIFSPLSWFFHILVLLARHLEEQRAIQAVRALSAHIQALTGNLRRYNFSTVLGPEGLTDTAVLNREYCRYQARLLTEFIRLSTLSKEELISRVDVVGEEHIRGALRRGKGALLIGGHTGNWCYSATVLAALGYPITCILYATPIKSITELFVSTGAKFGTRVVTVGHDASRASLRALRANEVVILFFEASVRPSRSTWIPFGEAELMIDTGSARLAQLADPTVLFLESRGLEGQTTRVAVSPMTPPVHRRRNLSPEAISAEWAERLHQQIVRCPEQWWSWSLISIRKRSASDTNIPHVKPASEKTIA